MQIIAIGDAALMDGFALLGVKTCVDASASEINSMLTDLSRQRERALVFMQQNLLDANIPIVHELRARGGSILICEIPQLHAADSYRPQVEHLIRRVLGGNALERELEH